MYAIETKNLTKSYGKNRGITDINLKVKIGEIYGFAGPNGAGKSTTIKTLLNFIYPTSGQGRILGKDIVKESKDIKNIIGYVPSEVKLYDDITVKELINYSKGFYKNISFDDVDYICKELEVEMDKKIGSLSLGNKKKVALAQAMIHHPKLLILDEPTSGLDPFIQKKLFSLILKEKEKGNTVFFSSHNLVEIRELCDEVAVIKDGKIIDIINPKVYEKNLVSIVHVKGNIKEDDLKNVSKSIEKLGDNYYKFYYTGDIDKLIKYISKFTIYDITLEKEKLEDSFFKYYEREEI